MTRERLYNLAYQQTLQNIEAAIERVIAAEKAGKPHHKDDAKLAKYYAEAAELREKLHIEYKSAK